MVESNSAKSVCYNGYMLKKTIIIVLILGLSLTTGSFFLYWHSDQNQLGRLGYTQEDIQIICSHGQNFVKQVLQLDFEPQLHDILRQTDFQSQNLTFYLQELKRLQLPVESIVTFVNHPNYRSEEDYSIDQAAIMLHQYYLPANHERYFTLLEQLSTTEKLSSDEIVALVNSNRDREFYSNIVSTNLDDNILMLVNKYYYLEADYEPELVLLDQSYGAPEVYLESETFTHFDMLFQAALASGIRLYITSGYRGYAPQEEVFLDYLSRMSEEEALTYAAKPGFSEHQTGFALDVFVPGETTETFQNTFAASWLAEHAHEFGFILRYPPGKENLTGYSYEAWHFRYVGCEAANYIYENNLTLEEYWAVFVQK